MDMQFFEPSCLGADLWRVFIALANWAFGILYRTVPMARRWWKYIDFTADGSIFKLAGWDIVSHSI